MTMSASSTRRQPRETSLPSEVGEDIRSGRVLVGDDFTQDQLERWFAQEQEAFFHDDAGNSDRDPWYAYMRYVNTRLGFERVRETGSRPESVLVLGPGSGIEIEEFAANHPDWQLNFLEASSNFSTELRRKWPAAVIVPPRASGDIDLLDESQTLVCAFSVLHHIPNVSKVMSEIGRVTRCGGTVLVREPCSSMGDWRGPRSATPNERGISRAYLTEAARRSGLRPQLQPVPVLLEPLNKIIKRTIGYRFVPFWLLYLVDRSLSGLAALNDHYWRDTWFRKLGPSSYFYVFRKE